MQSVQYLHASVNVGLQINFDMHSLIYNQGVCFMTTESKKARAGFLTSYTDILCYLQK